MVRAINQHDKKWSILPEPVEANWTPYLILYAAGIVDNTDTSGVGSNVQPLNDLCQENFYLLKLWGTNAPAAVHDEHDVCGTSFAQPCRYTWRDTVEIIVYS